jgi:hypothetical protein
MASAFVAFFAEDRSTNPSKTDQHRVEFALYALLEPFFIQLTWFQFVRCHFLHAMSYHKIQSNSQQIVNMTILQKRKVIGEFTGQTRSNREGYVVEEMTEKLAQFAKESGGC